MHAPLRSKRPRRLDLCRQDIPVLTTERLGDQLQTIAVGDFDGVRLQSIAQGARHNLRVPPLAAIAHIVYPPILITKGAVMTHTVREKSKLLARVRRIRGQVEAIERALEAEAGCADVLQVIASVRGAVNGLMAEVIEDHIRCHVTAPSLAAKRRDEGAEHLIEVVRAYLK